MSRPAYDPWRDVDGVHISDGCRVEQIAVSKEHGALPSRLSKRGEVVGRGTHRAFRHRDQGHRCPAAPAARDQRARPEWRWPVTVRWGCSPLDRRHHAIDESREHPRGALRAECGHLLVLSTWLSEEPAGRTCSTCAEIQATRAVTRQIPQQPGGAR